MDNVNHKSWTSLIPEPEVFIDIGVKAIGDPTCSSEAKDIHAKFPNAKIIGFEPNPNAYEMWKKKYPGQLLKIAVADRDADDVQFYYVDRMFVRHARPHQKKNPNKIPTRSLDSLEAEMGPWNNIFVWSDTEGCELEILQGARRLLEEEKIIGLNLEIWWEHQGGGWAHAPDIIEFLKQYGFSMYHKWSSKSVYHDAIFLKDD